MATLLVAIAWLMDAATTEASSAAYVFSRASASAFGLTAAIGLVLISVGAGFTLDPLDQGTAIAAGVLQAAGAGVLYSAVTVACVRGYLNSRPAAVAQVGLGLLAGSGAAVAVVGGLVFGPDVTLTGIRAGMPIAIAIQLAAVAVLGLAAWIRVRELAAGAHSARSSGNRLAQVPIEQRCAATSADLEGESEEPMPGAELTRRLKSADGTIDTFAARWESFEFLGRLHLPS